MKQTLLTTYLALAILSACHAGTQNVVQDQTTKALLTDVAIAAGKTITINGTIINNGTATGFGGSFGSLTGMPSDNTPLQTVLDSKLGAGAAASLYVSTSGSYSNPSWITQLAWSKISFRPTTMAGYGIAGPASPYQTGLMMWQDTFWNLDPTASAVRTRIGLGNVENTALSTWAGSANLTTLSSNGVTAGSYTAANITVDSTGRITAASNGSAGVSTVTGTANEITVTGTTMPVLSLPSALTFTGKTITGGTFASPILTTPRIANGSYVADANGNALITFTSTASAVNGIGFANGATGSNPTWTASGGDTNVGETHVMKGTGSFTVGAGTTSGNSQEWLNSSGSVVASIRNDGWFVSNFGLGFNNWYTPSGGLLAAQENIAGINGIYVNCLANTGPTAFTANQALSGAGAVNLTTTLTKFTSTGAAQALSLADGKDGQIKIIIHTVAGGSGILTPTTKTGFSALTFTNAGDSAVLIFNATVGWVILSVNGGTITP